MKPTIFIDRPIPAEVKAYLSEHCSIDHWDSMDKIPRDTLIAKLSQAQGILTAGRTVDEWLLSHAPQLKAVSTISVGYDHFNIEAMKRHHVIGTNTPYVLDDTVADLVLALMLACARRVTELDRYVKRGEWKRTDGSNLFGIDVHHATLGIIGMGRIGEAVARRAGMGFGMEVQYYNRSRKPEAEERLGVRYSEMNRLLETSDFVVMMTPLTAETEKLIGRAELKMLKSSAIFINASRGQTVDEAALIEALREGWISGAGLDVFEREPIDPDHPFLSMDNVITLPHIGSATAKTRLDMVMHAAQNLVMALSGEQPPALLKEFQEG